MIIGINDGKVASLNYKNQPLVKNWVATVTPNPEARGELRRVYWSNAGEGRVRVPQDLRVGDIIEFAADQYRIGKKRIKNRLYAIVVELGGGYMHAQELNGYQHPQGYQYTQLG